MSKVAGNKGQLSDKLKMGQANAAKEDAAKADPS